jgi:hypothetical protein
MNKKARRIALLAAGVTAQPETERRFSADDMVRIPGCRSIIEVLRRIKHGGPEWARRYVTLWFPGSSNAWVQVYPLQDENAPYFDFMYTHTKSPQEALSALLLTYPQCAIIDWSPGRLACIQAQGADIETLADVIRDVIEAIWDQRVTVVDASYEEMASA